MTPKNTLEDNQYDYDNHHKPRNLDKKKRNKKGFGEDVQAKRAQRISFKNYIRELEEEELDSYDMDDLGE